jgi:anti-sigma28 factor (negative regulator of flagellin synthesis)
MISQVANEDRVGRDPQGDQKRASIASLSAMPVVDEARAMESPAFQVDCQRVGVQPMSGINSVGGPSPLQKIVTQPVQKQIPADAAKPLPLTDRVELSGVGHLLKSLQTNDIRADKVAQIKAQIESGTYEDDQKLDVATDRLLDDLLK